MPNRILVPVDGSANVENAIDFAVRLAKSQGGQLVFVHVLTDRPLSPDERRLAETEYVAGMRSDPVLAKLIAQAGDPDAMGPKVLARLRENEVTARRAIGHHVLDQAAMHARAGGANIADKVLENGDAAARIAETAIRLKVDQVVMGARGLGGLAGLVLGSVSQKVVHLVSCPCTIVK